MSHYTKYLTDNPVHRAVIRHSELSIKGQKQPPYEVEIYRKDGSRRWLQVNETPVLNSSGDVTSVEGIAHDVTPRKIVEEALRTSEERFRQLIEAAFKSITITENAVILAANEPLAELLGYKHTEIIGMPLSQFVTPESFDIIMEKIRSDHARPYEIVCITRDGRHFPAEVCGKSVNYKGRKVRITALRDISERRRSEEKSLKIEKLESLGVLAGGHSARLQQPSHRDTRQCFFGKDADKPR